MVFSLDEPDRDYILERVREVDIFEYYLGVKPDFTKWFVNPLRPDDDSPGCNFYVDRRGRVKFHDWARDWNWDCFNLVQHLYQCNFINACNIIARDFGLIGGAKIDRPSIVIEKKQFQLRVKSRPMYSMELEYWNSFGMTVTEKELNAFGIYGLEAAWFNNRVGYMHDRRKLAFVYVFGDSVGEFEYKLYFPLEKPKFIHDKPWLMQGARLLPPKADHLIITKSFKDVFFMRKFGIYAMAPMSETLIPTAEQFERIHKRFDNVFSLYDRDYIGIKKTNEMKRKYGVVPLMFEKGEPKDFSDNLRKYGPLEMAEMVEYYKNLLL